MLYVSSNQIFVCQYLYQLRFENPISSQAYVANRVTSLTELLCKRQENEMNS
jgi:hypothetical protein